MPIESPPEIIPFSGSWVSPGHLRHRAGARIDHVLHLGVIGRTLAPKQAGSAKNVLPFIRGNGRRNRLERIDCLERQDSIDDEALSPRGGLPRFRLVVIEVAVGEGSHDHVVAGVSGRNSSLHSQVAVGVVAHYDRIWRQTALENVTPPRQAAIMRLKKLSDAPDEIALQLLLVL